MLFGRSKIISFDNLSLRITGMRAVSNEYTIKAEGDTAVVTHYEHYYDQGGDKERLISSARCSCDSVLKLLNSCKVMRWDGFQGNNPPGVCDGYMFTFTAEVNEGKTIYADGSNNYPKNYHELLNGIRAILETK